MSAHSARITSVDAIQAFKHALQTFLEEVSNALLEVDSDIARTEVWMEREQKGHWERQLRRRTELLARAKSELYRKQLQISAKDGKPSTVDEVRAVKRAEAAIEEAGMKLKAIKRWSVQLNREMIVYRGQAAALAGAVYRDLPRSLGLLDNIMQNLESYLAIKAPDLRTMMALKSDEDDAPSAARPGAGEPEPLAPDLEDALHSEGADDQPPGTGIDPNAEPPPEELP